MTHIDRLIIIAARLFIPPGWELVEEPPTVKARNDGDGTGRIVFGFYLRQVRPVENVDREHLRRHENRNR